MNGITHELAQVIRAHELQQRRAVHALVAEVLYILRQLHAGRKPASHNPWSLRAPNEQVARAAACTRAVSGRSRTSARLSESVKLSLTRESCQLRDTALEILSQNAGGPDTVSVPVDSK